MGRSRYSVCVSYQKRVVVGGFLGCDFLSFFFFLSFLTFMVSRGWNPFLSHVIREGVTNLEFVNGRRLLQKYTRKSTGFL